MFFFFFKAVLKDEAILVQISVFSKFSLFLLE